MVTPTELAAVDDDDVACAGEIVADGAAGVGACSMTAVGRAVGNVLLLFHLVPLMIQHHNSWYYVCTVCMHEYDNYCSNMSNTYLANMHNF